MKKISLFFTVIFLIISSTAFAGVDTKNWYQYSGYSILHNFTIKFPVDWQARIIDDQIQGFAPKNQYGKPPALVIQEFSGQTYDQIINYYTDDDTSLIEVKDILIPTPTQDIIGKQAIYQKKSSGDDFVSTFIKRGSLIVALVPQSTEYKEIFEAMTNSFNFNDGWHQYIDFNDKYTFIFPSTLGINSLDSGVEVASIKDQKTVFAVTKYENTGADSLDEKHEKIMSHGDKVVKATYVDQDADYYGQFVQEMLESFEFFDADLEGQYESYSNFPDIKDNHPNKDAINSLFKDGIINGYPDGTFQPDGEINRAELTKMIVAAKTTPGLSEFSGCFPDVQKEWFAPYICYAKSKGWVEGYKDGKFKPDTKVTRVEAVKIIINGIFNGKINGEEILVDQSVVDIKSGDWYAKYFIFADNRQLLDKQHIIKKAEKYSYLPDKNITRKEVAEMIYRAKSLK